jgi:hypothetical protein
VLGEKARENKSIIPDWEIMAKYERSVLLAKDHAQERRQLLTEAFILQERYRNQIDPPEDMKLGTLLRYTTKYPMNYASREQLIRVIQREFSTNAQKSIVESLASAAYAEMTILLQQPTLRIGKDDFVLSQARRNEYARMRESFAALAGLGGTRMVDDKLSNEQTPSILPLNRSSDISDIVLGIPAIPQNVLTVAREFAAEHYPNDPKYAFLYGDKK